MAAVATVSTAAASRVVSWRCNSNSSQQSWGSTACPKGPHGTAKHRRHHQASFLSLHASASATLGHATASNATTHTASVLTQRPSLRSAFTPASRFSQQSVLTPLPGTASHGAAHRHGRLSPRLVCSCVAGGSEVAIAAALFTLSTAAVIPLYTLMLLAPDRPLTKKVLRSNVPWIILGLLYAYLLALSWTPLTLPSMFSSKYWLPELPSITRMFSSTLTVASAWIHLLALDLYAARSIYFEGQDLRIETRHSLCLCLLFAPLGVLCHSVTKSLVLLWRSQDEEGCLHEEMRHNLPQS